jgi:hypothetical protein
MYLVIYAVLAFGIICSLAGCQKSSMPQPDFPLEEDVIMTALEQTGLPGVISESETFSSIEGHIAYVLRDPTETYGDTENEVVTASISSALTEGERFLGMIFLSAPDEPATLPFAWEDWKQQIVFTTLLFGGFEDEEEVYRAFSDKKTPEGEERFEWDAQLPAGYCRVSYSFNTFREQSYTVRITIYESKSLYEKLHQKQLEGIKEMEPNPVATNDVKEAFLTIYGTYNYEDRYEVWLKNLEEAAASISDKELLAAQYEYYACVRDYVSDEFYLPMMANHEMIAYEEYAYENGFSYRTDGFEFEEYSKNTDSTTYSFVAHMILTDADGTEKRGTVKGQISVGDKDGLITNFYLSPTGFLPDNP